MAFSDLPLIDPPSVNSERSELALMVLLNQQSGFICRPDKPDKGCDFDVELIIDGRGASNRRFGIQLKSVERLPVMADGITISYAFETSRLGYLLNRPAGEGLIVLYDVSSGRLYYDYAVNLFKRLMQERGGQDWQQQEMVNIHIPISNVLHEPAAITIHTHFRERFEKIALLITADATRQELNVIDPRTNTRYDLYNNDQVREVLLKHGLALLQEHELELCFWLLRRLPVRYIEDDPHLMMLAAMAYGEMGRRYDSENFIRKLYKRGPVPDGQKHMIQFCHLKNQMLLDQIELPEFIAGITAIRAEETNPKNILLLDLNLIFYELLSVKFYRGLQPDVLSRIRSVFDQAAQMGFDHRSRQLIEVNNAENFGQYLNYIRLTFFNDLAIRLAAKTAGRSLQLEEQRQQVFSLENEFSDILHRLYEDGKSRNDHLLQAQALLVRSRYLLSKEIDLYSQWPMLKNLRFHDEKTYVYSLKLTLSGHDHFMEAGYVELAHQSLQIGIDLIMFSREVYHYKDDFNLDELLARKNKFETQHELEAIALQFPALVERMKKIYQNLDGHYMYDTKDMDDEQLKGFTATIARAFGLPPNCYPNLLSELHNCRLFYQRANKDIELIPYDRRYDHRLLYRTSVRFVIYNKKTDLRSVPSNDVGALLSSWGL